MISETGKGGRSKRPPLFRNILTSSHASRFALCWFYVTRFCDCINIVDGKRRVGSKSYESEGIYGVSFLGGTIPKVVQLQKSVLTRFGYPCDVPFRSSGITRSPHKEKEVRKEHECYSYRKGNRGNRYGNLETSPAGRKRYPGKLL